MKVVDEEAVETKLFRRVGSASVRCKHAVARGERNEDGLNLLKTLNSLEGNSREGRLARGHVHVPL